MSTDSPATGATKAQIESAADRYPGMSEVVRAEALQRLTTAARFLVPPTHAIVPAALLPLLRQMKAESRPVNLGGSGHYAAVPRALWRDLMAVLDEMEGGQG
jgi:hypothetical protein